MGKEYKVSGVIKDSNKAFGMLRALEWPSYIIVYSDGGIKSSTYRDIVAQIKRVIPAMFETTDPRFAEEKFRGDKNVILKFTPLAGGSNGHLHETIVNLRQTNQGGSVVGIFIQQQATISASYRVSSNHGWGKLSRL